MMPVITERGKIKQLRGTGSEASYKPWILTRELNSTGTTANIIDWKHGRSVQLLSAGEEMYYYYIRWDDAVQDIREQFPLDLETTNKIAAQFGIRHPRGTMTTDMLVTYPADRYVAYSVKDKREDVDYELAKTDEDRKRAIRTAEKLFVEKYYWTELGVEWKLVFKEDLNPVFVDNIRRSVVYYDEKSVHDDVSKIKHLIATKQIEVDMNAPINYQDLIRKYIKQE